MAFSYVFRPVSDVDRSRTYKVVFWIGLGALAGWPFAALIGVPFAIEEVVIFGRDTMQKEGQTIRSVATPYWRLKRVVRLLEATVIVGAGLTVSCQGRFKSTWNSHGLNHSLFWC
jgi:alpha-1,2-mannosyltransferase